MSRFNRLAGDEPGSWGGINMGMNMGMMPSCPKCGTELATPFAKVCGCGWFDNREAIKTERNREKRAIAQIIMGAILLAVVVSQFATWGGSLFPVYAIKLKQTLFLGSEKDHLRIANYCRELRNWKCVEKSYRAMMSDHKSVTAIGDLARLKFQLGDYPSARKLFSEYFAANGNSPANMVIYGKILEASKASIEALEYYKMALKASEHTDSQILPVEATSGVVRTLIKTGRHREARATILEFHGSTENAKGYLNNELQQVEQVLKSRAVRMTSGVRSKG